MAFGENVLTWHEHENPFDLVSNVLNNLGLKKPGNANFPQTFSKQNFRFLKISFVFSNYFSIVAQLGYDYFLLRLIFVMMISCLVIF